MPKIIDASVAAKWFVDESGRDTALKVLEEAISKPQDFYVPELFFFELAHVLNRVLGSLTPNQMNLFEKTLNLGLKRVSMTPQLHSSICKFQALGLSGYDAAYVAVAEKVSGYWLTFDAKAHKIASKFSLSLYLGQVPL